MEPLLLTQTDYLSLVLLTGQTLVRKEVGAALDGDWGWLFVNVHSLNRTLPVNLLYKLWQGIVLEFKNVNGCCASYGVPADYVSAPTHIQGFSIYCTSWRVVSSKYL